MDHIIDRDILVEQPGMRIIIMILAVEEVTAAALRVEVPEQDAETAPGEKAGQVDGSGGFANASLDVIDGNLFQELKLITKITIAMVL
jgi:hypothetical protein